MNSAVVHLTPRTDRSPRIAIVISIAIPRHRAHDCSRSGSPSAAGDSPAEAAGGYSP